MEFPELGEHCAVSSCRQLDFLPMKCDGCQGLFCTNHFTYSNHHCSNPSTRDNQVPICPLCNAVVPVRPGELPDERVGQHIDTACRSKPALELKGKVFTNLCSFLRCKKREAVSCTCSRCGQNFCLAHRNELDHNCEGRIKSKSRRVSSAGAAAIFRAVFNTASSNRSRNNHSSKVDHGSSSSPNHSADLAKRLQEEEDRKMALALSASLNPPSSTQGEDQTRRQSSSSRENSCILS